ncbi:MAG: hypothetical protein PHH60_04315 [Candidatus Margulisbacteria bacterium]|nr:hypothetical protein [Candidatus Margulisiibacteriota bacterium]
MKKLVIGLFVVVLASTAFGGDITISGSPEFLAGDFVDTVVSSDAVVLSTSPEGVWAVVRVNSTSGKVTDEAAMVTDNSGGAIVAWPDLRNDPVNAQIYAARVNSLGAVAWEKALFAATEYNNRSVKMTISKNGGSVDGVILVWKVNYTHLGVTSYVIASSKIDLNGNYVWYRDIKGIHKSAQDLSKPQVISDNKGGAIYTWVDKRSGAPAIYAQHFNETGTRESGWATTGTLVCTALADSIQTNVDNPKIVECGTDAYVISWTDGRDDITNRNRKLYARRVLGNGTFDTAWGTSGIPVNTTASTGRKSRYAVMKTTSPAGLLVAWDEGEDPNRDLYAQLMSQSGGRLWGDGGKAIAVTSNDEAFPVICEPTPGQFIISWIDFATIVGHIQLLNSAGTPQWGTGGKTISSTGILNLVGDGLGGVYASAATTASATSYLPIVHRFSSSGDKLWGNSGYFLSSETLMITDPSISLIKSESPDINAVWIDNHYDVYVQKVKEFFLPGGSWTSAKIENTAAQFKNWNKLSWSAPGGGTTTGYVKSASSGPDLDGVPWQSVANGGVFPSIGKWAQAKLDFTPAAGRTSTPVLFSVTLNYSTEVEDISPEVKSVKVSSKELISGDIVSEAPVIDVVLTDNYKLAEAKILLDGGNVTYQNILTTDTRWELRCQPSVPIGDHTLRIEVKDWAGNAAAKEYTITRSSQSGVKSGKVTVKAQGSSILVGYELLAPAKVNVQIWDIEGKKVMETAYDAGVAGGNAGYQEVPINASNLPIGAYIIRVSPTGAATATGKFSISQ